MIVLHWVFPFGAFKIPSVIETARRLAWNNLVCIPNTATGNHLTTVQILTKPDSCRNITESVFRLVRKTSSSV
jgi:hypothetical protein